VSGRVWFRRRLRRLWPVAWQGWALVLIPAVVAVLLMVLIGVSGAGDNVWFKIGFFAAVMAVAAVVYGIALDKSERISRFDAKN
jgi:hypothetical protein